MQIDAPRREWLLGWALWTTPVRPRIFIVAVETLAVTALVLMWCVSSSSSTLPRPEPVTAVLLCVIAAVFAELTDRTERLRRFIAMSATSLTASAASLWCFAAALLLSPRWAGLAAVAVYGHTLLRARRHSSARYHRLVFTGATEVLATLAASTLAHGVAGADVFDRGVLTAAAVVLGAATYRAVNHGLIVTIIVLSRAGGDTAGGLRSVLRSSDETTEIATLALAVLLALALADAPLLAPFALPGMVLVLRSALVRDLQQQASYDGKTGLLNATAWQQQVERMLQRDQRSHRPGCVLMVDLDHFKAINDTHGHLTGDAILRSVAGVLDEALRAQDVVGRHGGEEFVAYLGDADVVAGAAIAERLRERIAGLALPAGISVSASIGLCVSEPGARPALEALVQAADEAMYDAKREGRNLVRVRRIGRPAVVRPVPAADDRPADDDGTRLAG